MRLSPSRVRVVPAPLPRLDGSWGALTHDLPGGLRRGQFSRRRCRDLWGVVIAVAVAMVRAWAVGIVVVGKRVGNWVGVVPAPLPRLRSLGRDLTHDLPEGLRRGQFSRRRYRDLRGCIHAVVAAARGSIPVVVARGKGALRRLKGANFRRPIRRRRRSGGRRGGCGA
jgi:hypothetical protein